MKELKIVWGRARIPNKWKILSFSAIVLSKLLYGLETIQMNSGMIKKVEAFQYRALRRILGWPPTHIDRERTNKKLRHTAEGFMGSAIVLAREMLAQKRLNILGHIVRAKEDDPMKTASLKHGDLG